MAGLPKLLTESNVGSRLSVPNGWWHIIRLSFPELEDRHEMALRVVDGVGMLWEFCYAIREKGRYKKPVLQSSGWLKFVNHKGLGVGDMVILETVENQFRGTRFMITALKYHADGHYWLDV